MKINKRLLGVMLSASVVVIGGLSSPVFAGVEIGESGGSSIEINERLGRVSCGFRNHPEDYSGLVLTFSKPTDYFDRIGVAVYDSIQRTSVPPPENDPHYEWGAESPPDGSPSFERQREICVERLNNVVATKLLPAGFFPPDWTPETASTIRYDINDVSLWGRAAYYTFYTGGWHDDTSGTVFVVPGGNPPSLAITEKVFSMTCSSDFAASAAAGRALAAGIGFRSTPEGANSLGREIAYIRFSEPIPMEQCQQMQVDFEQQLKGAGLWVYERMPVQCDEVGSSSAGRSIITIDRSDEIDLIYWVENRGCSFVGNAAGVPLGVGRNLFTNTNVNRLINWLNSDSNTTLVQGGPEDEEEEEGGSGGGRTSDCTSILDIDCDGEGGEGIIQLLGLALGILTAGVGILATIGLVVSGIQYVSARDDAGKVAKVKSRIFNIMIGLLAYGVMWVVLQWLIPGGILNGGGGTTSGSSSTGGGGGANGNFTMPQ